MPATVLDDWKILPRLMMLAVTILTYQAVLWYMDGQGKQNHCNAH